MPQQTQVAAAALAPPALPPILLAPARAMPRRNADAQTYAEERKDTLRSMLETGGAGPLWTRPWVARGLPRNAVSGKYYRSTNILLLGRAMDRSGWDTPIFLTFAQAKKLGGHVRRGEKSTKLARFVPRKRDEKDPEGVTFGWFKPFRVFNIAQTSVTVEELDIELTNPEGDLPGQELAERMLFSMQANIEHFAKHTYYSATADKIYLQDRELFESPEAYYSAAFHELVRWTGFTRADADVAATRPGRALEALTADLGASFLCASMGIRYVGCAARRPGHEDVPPPTAPEALSKAAARAQEAFDCLTKKAAAEGTLKADAGESVQLD